MDAIRLCGLSIFDAENIVTEIWQVLEEHNISSPDLHFGRCRSDRMHLELRFANSTDTDLILWAFVHAFAQYDFIPAEAGDDAAREDRPTIEPFWRDTAMLISARGYRH